MEMADVTGKKSLATKIQNRNKQNRIRQNRQEIKW